MQLKNRIDQGNFFRIEIKDEVDLKLRRSIELINKERCKILAWPLDRIESSAGLVTIILNMRLCKVISPRGRLNLTYFMIQARVPNARIKI